MHLLGNMLFLWVFGDNVEDYFGHVGYLCFYVVCGIGSGLAHVLFNWHSPLPAIGASGAISGVMGAYMLLFPRAPDTDVLLYFSDSGSGVFHFGVLVCAAVPGGDWPARDGVARGVAFWAHIGGFLMGVAITLLVKRDSRESVVGSREIEGEASLAYSHWRKLFMVSIFSVVVC